VLPFGIAADKRGCASFNCGVPCLRIRHWCRTVATGQACAFESRSLSAAEKRYPKGEQELLAVVPALRVWRCYLQGPPIKVIADHSGNTCLPNSPLSGRCRARWAENWVGKY
jgi:RNase H-like domain found in reverse transcriptase